MPDKEWASVALALMHEAKNLYNTCTFLIRQINSAYIFDPDTRNYRQKDDLHEHQRKALISFNRTIDRVNAKRRLKQTEKTRFVASLEPVMTVAPLYIALDVTILDNLAKSHVDHEGQVVYRRLPASAAQQVVRSVIDVWKASLSAQKDFAKNPGKYTGKPSFPDFKAKDGHFPLEMPYATIAKGLPKPAKLPDLVGVSSEQQERFYAYDLKSAAAAACEKRGWADAKPQHLRIVGDGASKVKIEAVVSIHREYPVGSLLHRLGAALEDLKTFDEREKFIISTVKDDHQHLRIAGVDFGQSNIATVGFSTGNRAVVHSGERPNQIIDRYHKLMDKRLAACATPRLQELQRLQQKLSERGDKLSKAQRIELRQEQKRGFSDTQYRNLAARLNRIKSDFEHKISTDIVEQCVKHKIDLIVIGRNKGWKSDIDSGAAENRRFHAIAHARLISLIRYKAEAYGMGVVTTEESYTSQSSFIDGDELPVHSRMKKQGSAVKAGAPVQTNAEADHSVRQQPFSGKRSAKNRTWFVRHNVVAQERFWKVHADVNGAFNIIRKVFTNFRHHAGLTYKFTVRWISPRRGAVVPTGCL
jgi:putative transposase